MRIKDYEAHVTINDTEIPDWKSIEVGTQLGDCETNFSVNIGRPLDLSIGDLVTITSGFGGKTYPLITDKEIEEFGGSVDNFTVSGAGSLLTRKSPTKTRVYVNVDWLKLVAPGYVLRDGVIYRSDPGTNPYKIFGVSVGRLFINHLPGRNMKDVEFECIVRSGLTYYDIAQDIVRNIGVSGQSGYSLVSNVPNLPLAKTFVLNAGETHWSALARFFSYWKPFIYVKDKTIYVMDIGGNRQAQPTKGAYVLSADSFEGYQWRVKKNIDAIDHIVIHGPDARNTTVARSLAGNRRKYSEVTLSGEEVTESSIETQDQAEVIGFDDFLNTLVSDWNTKYTLREVKRKYDYIDPSNSAITQETITVKNPDNVTLHQTINTYKWASYKIPVGVTMEKWSRIPTINGGVTEVYGGKDGQTSTKRPASYEFRKVEATHTLFGDFVDGVNQSEFSEETYGERVYWKSKEVKDGTTYYQYAAPQPINDALQMGYPIEEELAEDGTGLKTSWGIIRKRMVRFDISSPYLIRKVRTDHTFVPYPVGRTVCEDIPVYNRQRFPAPYEARWEYFMFNGALVLYEGGAVPVADFHPKVEFTIPDVKDEATARKIAERIMTSQYSDNTEFTIKTTAPIPGVSVGGTIQLPNVTKRFYNWDSGEYENITIAGGHYWIVGVKHHINNMGEVLSPSRVLEVYDLITVRKWY